MGASRQVKRLGIITIYFIIFFLIGLVLFFIFKPDPTCFDGKQNQNEEKVDCGGPCEACYVPPKVDNLSVKEKRFVYGGPNTYDVVAKITNPNARYGGKKFLYKFILKDASGSIITQREGADFILPAETKYLIETNLESQVEPKSIEVDISIDITDWEEFSGYEEPKLVVSNKEFNSSSSVASVFGEVYGLVKNESAFDFNVVNVNVVLRDGSGNPIALNKTEMRTVNSGEQRDFNLTWPFNIGEVKSVEVEAEADVYDSLNFIKKYLPEQKFQQY